MTVRIQRMDVRVAVMISARKRVNKSVKRKSVVQWGASTSVNRTQLLVVQWGASSASVSSVMM